MQPIPMQISEKQIKSLISRSNFEHFEKKKDPQSLYIPESTDWKTLAQINI